MAVRPALLKSLCAGAGPASATLVRRIIIFFTVHTSSGVQQPFVMLPQQLILHLSPEKMEKWDAFC